MRNRLFSFLLTITLLTSLPSLDASLITVSRFSLIQRFFSEHSLKNTLVFFDIDNTLARPHGLLGSDEWFDHQIGKLVEQGIKPQDAVPAILPLYCSIQQSISLQHVDPDALDTISYLQERKIPTMCLTARSLVLAQRTAKQLQDLSLSFANSSLSPEENLELSADFPFLVHKGIIFCNNNDKGKVLNAYLTHCNHQPKNLVFIDDKLKNLESVGRSLDPAIDYTAIHFNYNHRYGRQFDAAQAFLELLSFLATK